MSSNVKDGTSSGAGTTNKEVIIIDDPLVTILTYPELLDRREYLVHRLDQITVPPLPTSKNQNQSSLLQPSKGPRGGGPGRRKVSKPTRTTAPAAKLLGDGDDGAGEENGPSLTPTRTAVIPYKAKLDTHTDYLLKEMQWLSTDFASERKRHDASRRKLCAGIKTYFANLEKRHIKLLTDAEIRRRKLASRIGRECVKNWWNKLEKIVTYKQKMSLEQSRRDAMNAQLVKLVKQTEMYTQSLARPQHPQGSSGSGGGGHRRRSRSLSIEEALAAASHRTKRKAKGLIRDYSRLAAAQAASGTDDDNITGTDTDGGGVNAAASSHLLYGESTEDSGSDASYDPSSSDEDETTLRQAEEEEQLHPLSSSNRALELQQLREEEDMDIELVLDRMRKEAAAEEARTSDEDGDDDEAPEEKGTEHDVSRTKRVQFAPSVDDRARAAPPPSPPPQQQGSILDPGEDADDDGDASEVEDYYDAVEDEIEGDSDNEMDSDNDDNDGEFVLDDEQQQLWVDDETTIAAEESLPQEMSRDEEIRMLQAENELSVEELRARYAAAFSANDENESDASSDAESDEAIEEEEDQEEESMASERGGTRSTLASLLSQSTSGDGSAGGGDDDDVDDFVPDAAEPEVDDETTMEAEERLGRDMSYEDEIALLRREGEMSIDELRALYANREDPEDDTVDMEDVESTASGQDPTDGSDISASYFDDSNDQENDDEFVPAEEEKDDETTIEAEERLGREMSVEEEIALLQQEGEEPIEVLRERYMSLASHSKRKRDDDDDANEDDLPTDPADTDAQQPKDDGSDVGKAALEALDATAERARNTRATRPYLLAPWVRLREYQQVGLNWLVSLQSQRLNGILADEMGLGKTLQTISLLAYLAAYKGIWGPHLIVVPTSVILNWENELKRFAPALKVLCYYGSAKRRKELRSGWTKTNWNHVVITSYQLAVQDSFAFRRKKWYYLVLDEAQNIKNFQSQRWQTLIHFNTQRRLLLTGTPLQNSLMELWSLLHFLMPYIFRSRKQFSYWFANPMNSIIEGSGSQNEGVVSRLHGIIRPFVLRRLKKDVEAQLPGKFEHIVKCQLSRRQMFIYEEFLSRSSTRSALKKGGNFLGMMNVLMQLRKVCNHPDLFEPRSVLTPFVTDAIELHVPGCVASLDSLENRVGMFLLCPLWCGSQGLPSLDAGLRHDAIEAEELKCLDETAIEDVSHQPSFDKESLEGYCPALVIDLLQSIDQHSRRERDRTITCLRTLSSRRCQTPPFPYTARLQNIVSLRDNRSDSISCAIDTPAALLEAVRSPQRQSSDLDDVIKNFVFCVPKADSKPAILVTNKPQTDSDEALLAPVQQTLRPYRKAQARLSSFFPDRKLVQFDAGKLQTLAELLRELKRGGHRALIFTQMSKMLDILETFLNLNGHTYLRLDGSTSIERRQRLMDRFNNDPKVFCFILSTRSGGLGINLTGADSVIFYDQDWNPAMDAQAQDRAHRIGQTREVHIYRLVTEHTIEENILVKAQQKRNLDILVMDKGNFDASLLFGHGENAKVSESSGGSSVFTKDGIRAILGTSDDAVAESSAMDVDGTENVGFSDDTVENAMASLEDADDVQALRGAQKEAADELREFDETIEIKKGSESDADDDDGEGEGEADKGRESKANGRDKNAADSAKANDEEQLEEEFAAWQDQVGLDADAIEASLSPTERYGLKFREFIDPYVSIFAIQEYRRRLEAEAEVDDEIDIEAVELEKEREEQQAFDNGDLLATHPRPEDLVRQRDLYRREKARLKANKKRRKLTGENWETRRDAATKHPFWYNVDTGEAIWDKPSVLVVLDAFEEAQAKRFAAMPTKALIRVMSYLAPYPDRMRCSAVCRHWRAAATDPSFVRHVYPVEMGAYTRDETKMEWNHFRTIGDAIAAAQPGDTIELGDGHYWANADLVVNVPLRIVGDDNNAANVVVEMVGTLSWRSNRGLMEGVTFRRPKIASSEPVVNPLVCLEPGSRIDLFECCFDNGTGTGPAISVTGPETRGRWEQVLVNGGRGGISLDCSASLELISCKVKQGRGHGVLCNHKSRAKLMRCHLHAPPDSTDAVVVSRSGSDVRLVKCHVDVDERCATKILEKESGGEGASTISCSNNTAPASCLRGSAIPGFRPAEIVPMETEDR